LKRLPYKRDSYAGGLVILLGTVIRARSYSVDSLMHMGPGIRAGADFVMPTKQ
jgi:hypothetical protein